MSGEVLAENVVVADTQPRRRASVFQILRRVTDDTAGVKLVVGANRRQSREINMRPDDTVRPQFHTFVNDGIRADLNRRIQFRFRMYDGGWMDHFCSHRFTQLNPDSNRFLFKAPPDEGGVKH